MLKDTLADEWQSFDFSERHDSEVSQWCKKHAHPTVSRNTHSKSRIDHVNSQPSLDARDSFIVRILTRFPAINLDLVHR